MSVNSRYYAKVLRVVDGDTIHIDIALGFDLTRTDILRLAAIDVFELADPNGRGKEAKAYLEDLLPPGRIIQILHHGPDKYRRALCHVFYGANFALDLTDTMRALGFEKRQVTVAQQLGSLAYEDNLLFLMNKLVVAPIVT